MNRDQKRIITKQQNQDYIIHPLWNLKWSMLLLKFCPIYVAKLVREIGQWLLLILRKDLRKSKERLGQIWLCRQSISWPELWPHLQREHAADWKSTRFGWPRMFFSKVFLHQNHTIISSSLHLSPFVSMRQRCNSVQQARRWSLMILQKDYQHHSWEKLRGNSTPWSLEWNYESLFINQGCSIISATYNIQKKQSTIYLILPTTIHFY